MQLTLSYSALFMGLAGGPHCVAMCGAACGALAKSNDRFSLLGYQFGRLCGYALMGALATFAIQSIAWLSDYSKVLHPLWTFFHVFIFFWGVILIVFGRQPVWVDRIGSTLWQHVKRFSQVNHGHFYIGLLWSLMPCGLLYSALIMASFNAEPIGGAISMAAFAIGSSVSLFLAPWAWLKLKTNMIEPYGMRLAGLLLSAASGWAIWMDIVHQNKIWCTV